MLKMPENSDMATSVASGAEASTFTCMPRPIIMIATPEDAEQHQVVRVMRGRQKQQQTGQQQADGEAYQPRSVLVTELAEQNAANNPGPTEISSSTVAKLPLRPATVWTKGSI